jgi:hypothetical protein
MILGRPIGLPLLVPCNLARSNPARTRPEIRTRSCLAIVPIAEEQVLSPQGAFAPDFSCARTGGHPHPSTKEKHLL